MKGIPSSGDYAHQAFCTLSPYRLQGDQLTVTLAGENIPDRRPTSGVIGMRAINFRAKIIKNRSSSFMCTVNPPKTSDVGMYEDLRSAHKGTDWHPKGGHSSARSGGRNCNSSFVFDWPLPVAKPPLVQAFVPAWVKEERTCQTKYEQVRSSSFSVVATALGGRLRQPSPTADSDRPENRPI